MISEKLLISYFFSRGVCNFNSKYDSICPGNRHTLTHTYTHKHIYTVLSNIIISSCFWLKSGSVYWFLPASLCMSFALRKKKKKQQPSASQCVMHSQTCPVTHTGEAQDVTHTGEAQDDVWPLHCLHSGRNSWLNTLIYFNQSVANILPANIDLWPPVGSSHTYTVHCIHTHTDTHTYRVRCRTKC